MSLTSRRLLSLAFVAGCGTDAEPPAFPADYRASYQEVRDCRYSIEHDLKNIRVLAAPEAFDAYTQRTSEFAVGAVVLKEEYAEDDNSCSGPIERFTVMEKRGDSTNLGWTWEQVSGSRAVEEVDSKRCISCHTGCGVPPDGYDGTCAIP